jgi:hypothetical protein
LALVAWLISRLGGRERWQGFGAVAERCEALTLKMIGRYRISITTRPRRCFLGKKVISSGKGDRSVVGHSWGFSGLGAGYYTNRGWLMEGLLYIWPGDEGWIESVTGKPQIQPDVILGLFL